MKKRREKSKTWIRKNDGLLLDGLKIRDNGQCQRCGRRQIDLRPGAWLQTCHVRGRMMKNTRWFPANVFLGCPALNMCWWEQEKLDAIDWWRETFPDRGPLVDEAARRFLSTDVETLKEVHEGLKKWYEDLKNGTAPRSRLVPRSTVCEEWATLKLREDQEEGGNEL